jgi:hypothetical protein
MSTEENIVLNQSPLENAPQKPQAKLTDVPLSNQNVALNLMVSFLSVAQKRGTYTIDESAKIWECIKMFEIPQQPATDSTPN